MKIDALVLAAGVPPRGSKGKGFGIAGLHTPFGRLSYRMRKTGDRLLLHVDDGMRLPPGGIVSRGPGAERRARASQRQAGRVARWRIRVARLPGRRDGRSGLMD